MSQFNPGPGLFPPQIPGRVIRKIERYYLPDGSMREMRWVQMTFQAADGTWQTEEFTEVVPPLDDGTVPKDIADVLFCLSCRGLVCRSVHSFSCQACGLTYCVRCRVSTEIDGVSVTLCQPCARAAKKSAIIRMIRKLAWDE